MFAYWVICAQGLAGKVFWAVLAGTLVGILVGLVTEFYTSASRDFTCFALDSTLCPDLSCHDQNSLKHIVEQECDLENFIN